MNNSAIRGLNFQIEQINHTKEKYPMVHIKFIFVLSFMLIPDCQQTGKKINSTVIVLAELNLNAQLIIGLL